MDSESSELLVQKEAGVAVQPQRPTINTDDSASTSSHSPDLGSTDQHSDRESSTTAQMASSNAQEPLTAHRQETTISSHAQAHRAKHWRWLWLLTLLLVPTLAVTVRGVSGAAPEQTEQVQALPVETLTLESVSAYEVSRAYTGEIAARRSSNLGFERSGAVVEIFVDEGDRVQAGDPLAQLDVRSLDAQRQQLVAQKDQAIAQLQELKVGPRPEDIAAAQATVADWEQQVALGRIQRQRREDLYQRGAISREELDQQAFGTSSLESRLDQAQSQLDELLAGTRSEQLTAQSAQVRQLEARIQSIDVDLAKSILTAPFEGRVSARLIDEGVVVGGGQTVLRLVEDSVLEARVGVPVDTAAALTVGSRQQVQLGLDTYFARVAALLPELDATSRTVTIILEIAADTPLTVGQTVRLVLSETESTDGYWLPSTALVPGERGLWSVYLLSEPSPTAQTATEKPVYQVGRRDVEVLHTEADRVLVRGLITPGGKSHYQRCSPYRAGTTRADFKLIPSPTMHNLFYRNRQLLTLTLTLIVVWGLSAFFTLPRLEDPEITQRFSTITTFLPGASAERLESLVTEKIEEELSDIEEIESLESTSSQGVSVISVELKETIPDVAPVWAKVRSQLDDAIPQLPAGRFGTRVRR